MAISILGRVSQHGIKDFSFSPAEISGIPHQVVDAVIDESRGHSGFGVISYRSGLFNIIAMREGWGLGTDLAKAAVSQGR